ncbi:hypothetical protein [Alteromonas sp. P256]|uniref:hypothetical protein n=1 Tax=Alteromonas sp. P256 TaxID=3117399 RepID=UPI002FE0E551
MQTLQAFQQFLSSGRKRGYRFFTKNLSRQSVQFVRFWRTLTFAQRCYFIASLMMVAWLYHDVENTLFELIMFGLVLSALVKEIWPRFMKVWDSLPGKALILFIYAVIANFAIASAGGMVNDVTGVSSGALPYSHNFALILTLPSWFFITTLLALLLSTVLVPIYLLVLLILKPIGVHSLWHAPNYRFVFTTALVRYIWTFALLLKVITVAAQFGLLSGMDVEVSQGADIKLSENRTEKVTSQSGIKPTSMNSNSNISRISGDANDNISSDVNGDKNKKEKNIAAIIKEINETNDPLEAEFVALLSDANKQSKRLRRTQENLLAQFIFRFEADTHSRCEHKEGTKVVELNDYEILQISQNVDEDNAYTYEVIACQSPALGNPLRYATPSRQPQVGNPNMGNPNIGN